MGGGEASTPEECIFFAATVVLGAVVQASVFGSVASLLKSINEDRDAYERKNDLVQYKMDFLGVPDKLQNRVLNYYENMWLYHKSLGETTEQWITELSRPLQLELKINLFTDMLRKIPFLQMVDSAVVEELLLRLEARTCMKWDLVVRMGDPGDWLGFISNGSIAVLDPEAPNQDVVLKVLRSGAHFGELMLFSGKAHKRTCSLQALGWVQLQVRCIHIPHSMPSNLKRPACLATWST